MTLHDDKRALRERMRTVRTAIAPALRAAASLVVVDHLLPFLGRGPVAFFASLGDEIDTGPLDEALRGRGLTRLLPQVVGADLVFRSIPASVRSVDLPRSAYGVPEPTIDFSAVDLARASAVVVPGLAFDEKGWRIGYGRGFYDRALSAIDLDRAVGLGYDEQIVDAVPHGAADIRLRALCTPSRGVRRMV